MDSGSGLLEGERLSRYLRSCIELTQANKVTIKNAFDIKAIDHLISLAKATKNDEEENAANFSLASMSLQASGKIYGFRVDSVYLDTLRLALEVPKKRCSKEVESSALDTEFEEAPRIKRRRVLCSYLADEGANDSPVEIDHSLGGYAFKNAMQSAHGNALGRLISYNLMPPETEGIDIEGSSPWWSQARLKKVHSKVPVSLTKQYLPLMIDNVHLNFNVPSTSEVKTEDSTSLFDMTEDPSPVLEDIAPLEMSDSEDSDNVDLENVTEFDSEHSPSETVEKPLYDRPGEFSFIYESCFRPSRNNTIGFFKRYDIHGTEKKARVPRGKKQEQKYLSLRDCTADLDKKKPNGTYCTGISPSSMDKWTENVNVLEPSVSQFKWLTELFAFPNWHGYCEAKRPAEKHNESRTMSQDEPVPATEDVDGTSDDPGTTGDGFPIVDLEADDSEADFFIPMSQPGEDRRFDDLVSAPGISAEVLNVTYTKTARMLNMRQMKGSFWKVLTKNRSRLDLGVQESFRTMYSEALSLLSETNNKNINIPIAFVATLSLCNEKHLELTRPNDESEDFFVGLAPTPRQSSETNVSKVSRGRCSGRS